MTATQRRRQRRKTRQAKKLEKKSSPTVPTCCSCGDELTTTHRVQDLEPFAQMIIGRNPPPSGMVEWTEDVLTWFDGEGVQHTLDVDLEFDEDEEIDLDMSDADWLGMTDTFEELTPVQLASYLAGVLGCIVCGRKRRRPIDGEQAARHRANLGLAFGEAGDRYAYAFCVSNVLIAGDELDKYCECERRNWDRAIAFYDSREAADCWRDLNVTDALMDKAELWLQQELRKHAGRLSPDQQARLQMLKAKQSRDTSLN